MEKTRNADLIAGEPVEELIEENVIVFNDDEGNEYFYQEDIVIPLDGKQFAILVPLESECDCEDDCDCEVDLVVARVDIDEQGEAVYVETTDEEYDAVVAEYEKIIAE
ncbi:MAG: DUF1292 domain-containing protein [Bacillota bacterium]